MVMIHILNLSKSYGRRAVLSDITLMLKPGEVTLLLGANGAGKSTLLRCLLGICEFDGDLHVDGLDPRRDGQTVRSLVGYMPQTGGLHADLTVDATVRLFAGIRGVAQARGAALLADAGLSQHAATLVGELSGGMRQRLGFVLALLPDPPILLLDEPSASLDAASRAWLARSLRAAAGEGRLVVVSTHSGQELLAPGDRRIVLEDGRIVEDEEVHGRLPHARVESGATARPRPASVLPLVAKELRDGLRNRWLIGYAIVLGVLGVVAAATAQQSTSGIALQAFGRTTATLMNLCLLLAPLIAVLMGAAAIAGERDRGTLEHLLAQPLSRTRILLAKHLGLLVSLTFATCAGFLPAGLLILSSGVGPGVMARYLLFPMLACVVGGALAAVGMLISVSSRTAVQAQGTALFVWFTFVLLYDLMLMGSLAITGLPVGLVGAALVANPVDAGRVLGILALEPDLYLLGPAGAYLTARLSPAGAATVLGTALAVWASAPLAAAVFAFRLRVRRDPARGAQAVTKTTGRPSAISTPGEA
jgi:Cu-processing system permease protein